MNDKFFSLPEEKQQRIINAGYHVFSKNSYKKSPVGEIALTAGISKSLLFHYFHNKKELYLFLWNKAAEVTLETVKSYACYPAAVRAGGAARAGLRVFHRRDTVV